VFLKLPFEGNGGRSVNKVWHWRWHFLANNVREHFPQDELTLVKNNLLEADSLVEWEWIQLIGVFNGHSKQQPLKCF